MTCRPSPGADRAQGGRRRPAGARRVAGRRPVVIGPADGPVAGGVPLAAAPRRIDDLGGDPRRHRRRHRTEHPARRRPAAGRGGRRPGRHRCAALPRVRAGGDRARRGPGTGGRPARDGARRGDRRLDPARRGRVGPVLRPDPGHRRAADRARAGLRRPDGCGRADHRRDRHLDVPPALPDAGARRRGRTGGRGRADAEPVLGQAGSASPRTGWPRCCSARTGSTRCPARHADVYSGPDRELWAAVFPPVTSDLLPFYLP